MSKPDHAEAYAAFKAETNMTATALEKFLETEESKAVGWKGEGADESVGHASGRGIVEIKRKKKGELTDEDYAHMVKVVGYIRRHCAQGPDDKADVKDSRWRYSLMNWGHDPLRASR